MKIIQKDTVKFMKKSMLRSIIAAITKIQTSYESSYFSIIPRCLCVNKYTFLVVCKESSNYLIKRKRKVTIQFYFLYSKWTSANQIKQQAVYLYSVHGKLIGTNCLNIVDYFVLIVGYGIFCLFLLFTFLLLYSSVKCKNYHYKLITLVSFKLLYIQYLLSK